MPYEIKQNVANCSGYAVVKRGTENVVGCHETAADAQKQMAALYAAEPEMFAKSLSDAVLINVHNKLHGEELNSVTATLHHTLAEEMKSRNIDHENVDCPLHKMVVLKSELVLSKEKADAIVKGQPTSGDVHLDTIMGGRKKKKKKLILEDEEIEKGDKPGHPFRGNQHTRGGGSGASAETAGGTTEQDAQQMADEQDNEEKISELEDKFSEKQSQAEDEMRQIEDKVKIGREDYNEEHRDEDGQPLDSYDDYSMDIATDAQNEMQNFRDGVQEIDFGDNRTFDQRQEQIDQLEADWEQVSDRLLEKFEQDDSEELNFSSELDDFGGWVDEVINLADSVNREIGKLSGVGKSSNMVVVQELLTVDGTVFALRKMHGSDMSMYGEMPEMEEEYDSEMEMENYLTPRQKCQYEAFEWIAEKFGPWDKRDGANGAHYMEASANPFKKEGMICANCVFYCGGRKCEIVSGDIDPNALCKLWIIEDTNLTVSKELSTEEQQDSVNKAIGRGDFVSWDNVGGVARGRVIQIMREGTLNVPNSSFKIKAEPDDPAVLIQLYRKNSDGEYEQQDVRVGHKMSELRSIQSLVKKKADKFTPPASVQAAGRRAVEWIKEGLNGDGFTSVGRLRARQLANGEALTEDTVRRMANYFTRHEKDQQAEGFSQGEKGYPRPGRVAWDAWGGDAGKTWSQNLVERLNKKEVLKSVDEKRFTLAPWYVPNSLDAHLEWTDPEELQKALWTYVKSGNHDIRLQHVPDTVAGQWVEAMTWPFEVEVPMMNLENGTVQKKTFPENTVFLGVQWEPWAWELVKKGQIRGFSIGGKAGRKEEDLYVVLDKSSGETVVKGN